MSEHEEAVGTALISTFGEKSWKVQTLGISKGFLWFRAYHPHGRTLPMAFRMLAFSLAFLSRIL